MPSHVRSPVSSFGKAKLAAKDVGTLTSTILRFLWMALPRRLSGWPLPRTIAICFLRSLKTFITHEDSRIRSLPTGEAVAAVCKTQSLSVNTISLSRTNATLHLVDVKNPSRTESPTVLLYFHGGAYVNALNATGQLPFILDAANAAGIHTVAVLEYTLAPQLVYPGQLAQAIEALQYLLGLYAASDIIISGDSAGGHLALSLIAHMIRAKPTLPQIKMSGKLKGVCLISPWVTLSYTAPSYRMNESCDYISARSMHDATEKWAPEQEIWADFLKGDQDRDFWSAMHGLVEKTLVTGGTWEVFYDDIKAFTDRIGAVRLDGDRDVDFDRPALWSFGDREIHVQPAVDKAMGLSATGTAKDILDWFAAV